MHLRARGDASVDTPQDRTPQIDKVEVGADEHRCGQVSAFEIRRKQVRAGQVREPEVGAPEVRERELHVAEVGIGEVLPLKLPEAVGKDMPGQVDAMGLAIREDGTDKVGVRREDGRRQVTVRQVQTGEVKAREIGPGEVASQVDHDMGGRIHPGEIDADEHRPPHLHIVKEGVRQHGPG